MRIRSIWAPGKRLARSFRVGAVFAVVAVLIGNTGLPALAGPPLFPDIVTYAPSGLYIEPNGGRYLLRFSNTAVNQGGRLEISVDYIGSKIIYQNVYDQNVGGNRVIRQQVHSDLIYHPQHNHFHFAGFAQYELLKKNQAGAFDVTRTASSKTTFCILDYIRTDSSGPVYPAYNTCGASRQGLSAGWGDTYYNTLYDQWIDLGTTNLTDGQYAIRSTADPDNRLFETNDFNNVGITYFSVVNGRVSSLINPATCTAVSAAAGTRAVGDAAATQVGAVARLSCSRFQAGETVDIYWGSANTTPKATATVSSNGTLSTFLATPPSTIGIHYWVFKGRTSGIQAAANINTIPSINLEPSRGEVASETEATLRGFSDSEQVEVRFYKYGEVIGSTVTVTASGTGSGSIEFPVPVGPFGVHTVEAVGLDSGAKATTTFVTTPTIELNAEEADVGDEVGVSLRGFVAGENVTITVGQTKIEVAKLTPSHSGSTSPSSSKFTVPDVETGEYEVFARGDISGLIVSTTLDIVGSGPSTEPTETPTSASTPTDVPTETATSPPEPTVTETPANTSPVADAGDDQVLVDSDSSGSEPVQLDGSASFDPEGGALTAIWTLAGQDISNELNPVVELSVGQHLLTLTATDPLGASSSDDVLITIDASALPTETDTP